MWDFDPSLIILVWKQTPDQMIDISILDLGLGGDLQIDFGSRENELSIIDQGNRLSGNI